MPEFHRPTPSLKGMPVSLQSLSQLFQTADIWAWIEHGDAAVA
jgi:hypothetical protein